jgi:long-chain fatty acid transport protein
VAKLARSPILFLAFALVGALFPAAARAELGSLFGINPRTMGMGAVSLVQGEASPYQVFSAPAALGYLRSVEVGVGGVYFDPRLKPFGTLVLNSNGTLGEFNTAGVLPGGGTLAALALPLGRERPLVLGVSLFLPFSSMIRVSGSPVNYPFYPLYTDISRNFFFVLGAGYEFIDGWSLGLNVRSTTKSSTYYTLRSDSSVNYTASATEAKGESRLSVSLLYDNEKRGGKPFTVGAMYRAKSGLETRIAADVTAFVPVQGEVISLPAFSPAEWALMGSWRLGERLRLSFDGAWALWSKYVSPYGSGNINTYIFSSANGAHFKDVPVLRFGVDYTKPVEGWVKRLSFRGGYLYHPSPVPDQTGDSNFVDNDRHLFSLGLGLGVPSPVKEGDLLGIDIFAQYNWLKSRDVHKSSATNVGAPGYSTGGKILLYGAGATMKF